MLGRRLFLSSLLVLVCLPPVYPTVTTEGQSYFMKLGRQVGPGPPNYLDFDPGEDVNHRAVARLMLRPSPFRGGSPATVDGFEHQLGCHMTLYTTHLSTVEATQLENAENLLDWMHSGTFDDGVGQGIIGDLNAYHEDHAGDGSDNVMLSWFANHGFMPVNNATSPICTYHCGAPFRTSRAARGDRLLVHPDAMPLSRCHTIGNHTFSDHLGLLCTFVAPLVDERCLGTLQAVATTDAVAVTNSTVGGQGTRPPSVAVDTTETPMVSTSRQESSNVAADSTHALSSVMPVTSPAPNPNDGTSESEGLSTASIPDTAADTTVTTEPQSRIDDDAGGTSAAAPSTTNSSEGSDHGAAQTEAPTPSGERVANVTTGAPSVDALVTSATPPSSTNGSSDGPTDAGNSPDTRLAPEDANDGDSQGSSNDADQSGPDTLQLVILITVFVGAAVAVAAVVKHRKSIKMRHARYPMRESYIQDDFGVEPLSPNSAAHPADADSAYAEMYTDESDL